jgi:hypothetical protein
MHYVSFNTIAHGMLLKPPFDNMPAEAFSPTPLTGFATDVSLRDRTGRLAREIAAYERSTCTAAIRVPKASTDQVLVRSVTAR